MPEPMDADDVSLRSAGNSRVIRSPKTFERSPTTFARSREGLGHHPLDRVLAFLRLRFGSEFLFSSAHLFFLCGKYGLLVGAILLFVQSMQKRGTHVLTLLTGLGLILLILVCHYVATRFVFVLERWDRRINGCLSSSVVPDALSLLALVGSSVFLVLGTIDAITTGSLEFVFWGVAVFIWGLFAALQALNLEGMNLQVNPELSPADEILGLIQFALKMLVRLTPVVFGVLVLVANLQLIVEIAVNGPETESILSVAIAKAPPFVSGGEIVGSSFVEKPPPFQNLHGIHTLFLAGILPGVMYLVYVFGHFVSAVFSVFLAAVPERGISVGSYTAKNDLTDP